MSDAHRAPYWDTLRRSLTDRANAFAIYMAQLASANGRGDDGFSRALEMCQIYGELLRDQVDYDWNEPSTPSARYNSIKFHLSQFITTERWIDRRFARGSQAAVPRALKTIAREQIEAHGLTHHEPVLTVGPPDSFETHEPSLYDYLFEDLQLANRHEALKRHKKMTLSIISMPYIEGTTTLWYPITLGHEIAHLRIDATKNNLPRTQLMNSLLDADEEPELAELVAAGSSAPASGSGGFYLPTPESPSRILNNWVNELLCDLNAVRLFGAAGLSAIAEFVKVLAPAQASAEFPTATHPPLSLRLQAMKQFLGRDGCEERPRYVRVWEGPLLDERPPHNEGAIDAKTAAVLRGVFEKKERIDQLIDHVCDWQLPHCKPTKTVAVNWVCDSLLDGVPAGTHYEDEDHNWHKLSIADVVNGAWAARDAFEPHSENGEADRPRGLLVDLDEKWIPEHEKRRRVDILASKAIDSVELARLWDDERAPDCRVISPNSEHLNSFLLPKPPDADVAAMNGNAPTGILAAAPIVDRMRSPGVPSSERLVVTPLFANSVHQAGIDVRLGPEFIVFKHASSAVFDPLHEQRDPRVLQERVHMGWGDKFFLHPGELVLAATLEYVVLPADVAAQVVTRSSYGRLGLTTATAVQVQPASRGCITLELVNHGNTPIALSPGARVGQLMLFPVIDSRPAPFGRYWFPVGPEFSKVGGDADSSYLIRLGQEAGRVGGRGDIAFCFGGDLAEVERFEAAAKRAFLALERVDDGDHKVAVLSEAAPLDLAKALSGYLTDSGTDELVVTRANNRTAHEIDLLLSVAAGNGERRISFRDADGGPVEQLVAAAPDRDLADSLARLRGRRVDPEFLAV